MKRQCEDCRHEISADPVRDDQRQFCTRRCHAQWKRRMTRYLTERREPVAFGDA